MDIFDKIGSWFQVVASVFFVLFLSYGLLRLSVAELKELKGGKK